MIGMMNVPCDSPAEFYAAPERYLGFPESDIEVNINEPSSYSGSTEKLANTKRPGILNLFNRRKTSQIKYLQDGRKMFDGELIETSPPPKLWEQLIVRTFVHKIEDEIQSPVDQFATLQNSFPRLTADHKAKSKSTFSLVSQDRVVSQCEKCCPDKKVVETCRWLSRKPSDVGNNPNFTPNGHKHEKHTKKSSSKTEKKACKSKFLTVDR